MTGLSVVMNEQDQVLINHVAPSSLAEKAGFEEGDIIAVAGVSFLADGMEVKLMEK